MPEYYTTKEVADKFRVSMQAIRNMIDRHEIQAVKIGRSYRIPSAEVERIGKLPDTTAALTEDETNKIRKE